MGQRRIDVAIGAALRIGRHRDRPLGDGEVVACVVQRVVAGGREASLRNPVDADVARCRRRCRESTRQCIAVGKARAADLIGQRRVCVAISPALRIGRHRDRTLGDGQVGARIVQRVVAGGREASLRNAVDPDIAGCRRRCRQRTRQRIAVGKARAADLIGQRRVCVAISTALRIGRDGDRPLGDGQVGTRIVQRVVARGREASLRNAVDPDIAGCVADVASAPDRVSPLTRPEPPT